MIDNKESKPTRTIIELNPGDPASITLSDGSVFKTEKYIINQRLITALGKWIGGDDESGKRTVFIPWDSIVVFDIPAKEIPESELSNEERLSVENRHQSPQSNKGMG